MSSHDDVTAADLSHAWLIAILMHHGGSIDLPLSALTETDALGGTDGAFHAVRMDPLPDGGVRLSVVARPGDMRPGEGVRFEKHGE